MKKYVTRCNSTALSCVFNGFWMTAEFGGTEAYCAVSGSGYTDDILSGRLIAGFSLLRGIVDNNEKR